MTVREDDARGRRPLDALGIGAKEERVYRWLLGHPGATIQEVARGVGSGSGKVQRALAAIESKGLATHTPQRPRRYVPASPDIALRARVLRRREELRRAEESIRDLQEHAAAARKRDSQEQLVELVTSRETEYQLFEQMQLTAQSELLTLIRMPMRITQPDAPSEEDQQPQREARARGVRFRSIVDAEFLDAEGAVRKTRTDMQAGEEVRVLPQLAFKMVLADRRIGLIPLNLQQPDSPALLVRSSALLDALYALFELLWERAGPIFATGIGPFEAAGAEDSMAHDTEELLALLAAGLNDKAIAHELELSMRTLTRRISQLMSGLEARTRFQAGWLCALRMAKAGDACGRPAARS